MILQVLHKLNYLEVDKLDIEKLAPAPVDLSKLSDVVKSDIAKKTVYDKLKINCDTRISKLEKKLTDHNNDKYITTPEFNTLAADVFNARLAKANLITKTILMLNCHVLIEKLTQINQNINLLKMS